MPKVSCREISQPIETIQHFQLAGFRLSRHAVGLAGLTGTPFDSGGSEREQGISKAGSRRIRSLLVELAWLWLRYQPQSDLSRWFQKRWAGSSRTRRIGIVAMARRLFVDLWRLAELGVVPPGAEFKPVTT